METHLRRACVRTCSRIFVPRLVVALDVRFFLLMRLRSRCVCQRRSDVYELRRFFRHHVHSCVKRSLPTSGRRNAVATSTVQSKDKYTKQDIDIRDMGMTKCFHGQTLVQAQVHCVVLGNRRASLLQFSSRKFLSTCCLYVPPLQRPFSPQQASFVHYSEGVMMRACAWAAEHHKQLRTSEHGPLGRLHGFSNRKRNPRYIRISCF